VNIYIQERGNYWDEMGVKTPHFFLGMRENKKTIKTFMRWNLTGE